MPLDGVAETWFVKVAEKIYGPYARETIARFVAEGRVKATSLVALRNDGAWTPARDFAPLQAVLSETRDQFKTDEPSAPANLLVFAESLSGHSFRLEHELRRLGAVADIQPGLYLLRTHRTAGAVRNAISQMLGKGDKLLVMDATRDRLAWFNLGPETDARIREVWNAVI